MNGEIDDEPTIPDGDSQSDWFGDCLTFKEFQELLRKEQEEK